MPSLNSSLVFRPLVPVRESLDASACKRTIWLDYEGNKYAPPTLMGWRVEDVYGAAIVEPVFATCARRYGARDPVARTHKAAARDLVDRAIDEKRHIASWSQHDLRHLCQVLDARRCALLMGCYVNALDIVCPWHRRTYGCTAKHASLAYIASLFDMQVPDKFGQFVVGPTLSLLRPLFKSGITYGDLTTEQRKRWVALVKHNQWDLRLMADIVHRIRAGNAPSRGASPDCGSIATLEL